MNVKTNVQAGQDLRFPAIDETSETVKPVDVEAERDLCRRRDSPINWATYAQVLDEIQSLREKVSHLTREFRVRANYRPEGK